MGGGLVTFPAHARRLRRLARCAYLEVPVAELARRLGPGAGRTRPLLAGPGGVRARLEALAGTRAAVYQACADLTLAASGLGPEEVAGILHRESLRSG